MNSRSNPTNGGIKSKAQGLRNKTSTKTGAGRSTPAPLSLCKMEEPKNVIEFEHAELLVRHDDLLWEQNLGGRN